MDYVCTVRRMDINLSMIFLMYDSTGLPTFFKNVYVSDFTQLSVDAAIQTGAASAVSFWSNIPSSPDTPEVEEGYSFSGTSKPRIYTEAPSHTATQKVEYVWDEQPDQIVQVWSVVNKTPKEIEEEKRQERISRKTIPEALADMMDVVGKTTIAAQLENMSDEDIIKAAVMFPYWEPDITWTIEQVAAIVVINYEGDLYKVVQPHTSQADWLPPSTPALYTPYRNTTTAPDPWVQPTGAHDAYAIGDRVTHDNPNDGGNTWIYESAIAANTTIPGRDGTFNRWWTPISVA